MEIVDSKNVFINSELNVVGNGENFRIDYPTQVFSAKYPAQIRLTCLQAVIRRSWYTINYTNNMVFIICHIGGIARAYPFTIPQGDYPTFELLASTMQNEWNNVLTAPGGPYVVGFTQPGNSNPYGPNPDMASTVGPTTLGPLTCTYNQLTRKFNFSWLQSNGGAGGPLSNNILPFTWLAPQTRTAEGIILCTPPAMVQVPPGSLVALRQDILGQQGQFTNGWEILGGRVARPVNPQLLFPPLINPLPAAATPSFTSYYPPQLSTLEAIYLRTTLIGNNYQTLGFEKDPNSNNDTELIPSTTLCKIPLYDPIATQPTPWLLTNPAPPGVPTYQMTDANVIVFQDFVGSQNLKIGGQNLTFCNIGMTDAEGRTLPPVNDLQSVAGNLSCKLTLRFEVLTSPATAQLQRESARLNPPTPSFYPADGTEQQIGQEPGSSAKPAPKMK